MTIPLLYSLSESYPEHRFVLVSRERFGQFFINKPANLNFVGQYSAGAVAKDELRAFLSLYRPQ